MLQLGGRVLFAWVEDRDAAKHPIMLMTFPTTKNYPAPVSVLLRLRNPDILCSLNYSIVYLQAKEKMWSHPNLKEMAPVKGKRTTALTGNIFRRLDIYK